MTPLVEPEIAFIAHDPLIDYPIRSKKDLLETMEQWSMVRFRGKKYPAARNADLLPRFFFPVSGPDEFVAIVQELLVARGLARCPTENLASCPPDIRVPDEPPATRFEEILSRIALALVSPIRDGFLPADRVDALDIILHGLEFCDHPDGLVLWREALWQQRFDAKAREAVELMGEYITAAAQRGEWAAISTICDCLDGLLDPALLAKRPVGGTSHRTTTLGALDSNAEPAGGTR